MKTLYFTIVLLFFMTFAGATISHAQEQTSGIWRVDNGDTQQIDAHSVCNRVVNAYAPGDDIMVPVGSAPEWTAFRSNLPTGVTLADCSYDLYCWGEGSAGRLGDGGGGDHSDPVLVLGGHQYIDVGAGANFSCGLADTGVTYCWGSDVDGQLGNVAAGNSVVPVAVAGGHIFTEIDTGSTHACGIADDGNTYCWGNNGSGRLGNGDTTQQDIPVLVNGGHAFTQISAGSAHTCALTAAGVAYCWGEGGGGRLGHGVVSDSFVPVAVTGGHIFADISTNTNFTCGVRTDGAAYCWGNRENGHLGDGGAITGSSSTPVAVAGGHIFAEISAGNSHACGVRTDGAAYCWGNGERGGVGDANTAAHDVIAPTAVVGSHSFSEIAAGTTMTCGVRTDGAAYCWGRNDRGQLGDGTIVDTGTPVAVTGGNIFSNIDTTTLHNCAF